MSGCNHGGADHGRDHTTSNVEGIYAFVGVGLRGNTSGMG